MLWAACVRNFTDSELAHSWFTGKEVETYTGAEEAVQVHIASRPGLCAFKLSPYDYGAHALSHCSLTRD